MISIPKVVTFLSYGLWLCFGLSNAAYAANEEGASRLEQATVIRGILINVNYDGGYVVKQSDGQEVHVHIDRKTLTMGPLKMGEPVEAKVDAQNHALSIRPFP
jgi:hypothetical protein